MQVEYEWLLGRFGDLRRDKRGRSWFGACFAPQCMPAPDGGRRVGHVHGLLAFHNQPRVTVERLIEGWSEQTRLAVAGRHVLAIQDTSEIKFSTSEEDRRGLGKIKKGNAYGVLLHAMLAVDADTGNCLGLVGGHVWTRGEKNETPHAQRGLADKESDAG